MASFITGEQARLARLAANLTIKEVADIADLGVNTVGRYEAQGRVGHIRTVHKLMDTYKRMGFEFPDERTIRLPEQAA